LSIATEFAAKSGTVHLLRHRATLLALLVTIVLTGFKLLVGVLSNSVGVLSEGIHSFLDLVSAAVAFYTVREAGKPADDDHPFGHGKIETLSSLFESVLLIVAAGFITYHGIDHLLHPVPLQHENWAIATIVVSMVVSYFMYLHNKKAAVEVESSAIHVNALHFLADVVASVGVLIGLVLLKWTGWAIIDPIIAFGVAAYIAVISVKQVRLALKELSDTMLPESEVAQVQAVLKSYESKMIRTDDLRTRKSGSTRHIDFNLVLCGEMSVSESHDVCDEIEMSMTELFPSASVRIHVEPCAPDCVERAQGTCEIYNRKLKR
jgi:cation diffusion facilitator family transporter